MKKFFGLAFCLALVTGFSACDDGGDVSVDNDDAYNELIGLSGTTWVKQENSMVIVETVTAINGGVTVTEIPRGLKTTTITFNADGTFIADFSERYTTAWDAAYIDGTNTDYTPNHGSGVSGEVPFDGYAGNYVDTDTTGDAHVIYTGLWKRVAQEDSLSNEESYTYDYYIKVLTRELNSFDIDDTDTDYSLADTITDDYTYLDEDVDWTDLGTISNLSVGGYTVGTEVTFDFTSSAFTFDTYFTDGVYTAQ